MYFLKNPAIFAGCRDGLVSVSSQQPGEIMGFISGRVGMGCSNSVKSLLSYLKTSFLEIFCTI